MASTKSLLTVVGSLERVPLFDVIGVQQKVMVMGSHGVMVIGDTVADTFNRLFYFERAAETYIRALQTGMPLRRIPDDIAEKTAREIESYPEQDLRHLEELKAILDSEGSDYAA